MDIIKYDLPKNSSTSKGGSAAVYSGGEGGVSAEAMEAALAHYLRKDADDVAQGIIRFLSEQKLEGGATFGNYFAGLDGAGGKVDRNGDGELNSMMIRQSLRIGDAYLCYDEDNHALKVYGANDGVMNLYALGGVSALGQSSVQGGGGGTSYNRLDSWASYDSSKAGWMLSALLGNDLNSRVTSLENGQIEGVATQEWVQNQGYLTELSAATSNALGAVKLGYSENGKNYPLLLDNNNRAYVNVPWSDTTYGVFSASANGLVPMASAANKVSAETAVGNYYLCADGKFRKLPANAFNNTTYSFVDANPNLTWDTQSKVATVGGVDIHVTMPANPNTWRPLGTGATDACAGNDARLSNSRPASDVYAWAKASTKPTYTLDEVADGSTRKLSNYLPLSGGTISNASFGKFIIERSGSANMAAIGFKNSLGTLGYFAVNTVNGSFVRYKADTSAFYTILDSANSSVSLSGSTLTVKINGTEKSLANTWRGIQDNLTSSTNTTESLSAKQGYLLANGSARDNTKLPLSGGTMSNTNVVTNLNADLLDGQHGAYYAKAVDVTTLQGYFTNGVANNADKLDGYHASNFARLYIHNSEWSDIADIPSNLDIGFHSVHVSTKEYSALLVGKDYAGSEWQIYFHPDKNYTDEVYYRKPSKNLVRTFAFTNSNVASATKLATARTINGTSFDGSANITTANWGTARNVSIADSDSTNTGSAVSVNGSAAVTLKLPATIKATLSGNAATATKLATSRSIWGQSFDGSANVSGAMTGVTNVDNLMHFDTVNGNGRVGIGTSTPDFPLSVYGNIATHFWVDSRAIVIVDPRQTAGYQKIEFNKGGGFDCGGIHWFHDQFSGYSFLNNCINITSNGGMVTLGAWGSPTLVVNETGEYVGIGTTSPSYKLDVSGVIHSSVGMFSDGYVSALGQNTSSDERLKDIKGDIDLSVGLYADAPMVSFEWTKNKSLGAQVGTIAQYWQRALPQVVHDRGDGYLSMQYDVAALLGTITIAKRVQNHEERIKELERENEALREQLKEFKG